MLLRVSSPLIFYLLFIYFSTNLSHSQLPIIVHKESVRMATKRSSHDRGSAASSEKAEQAPPRYEDEHITASEKPATATVAIGKHHDPNWDGEGVDFSNVDEKKVLRKMDIRLLPMLALLYLLSFLDRGNIGNAKIEGLVETLKMTGPEYNWCLTVFFFAYCAFEVPSNLM